MHAPHNVALTQAGVADNQTYHVRLADRRRRQIKGPDGIETKPCGMRPLKQCMCPFLWNAIQPYDHMQPCVGTYNGHLVGEVFR